MSDNSLTKQLVERIREAIELDRDNNAPTVNDPVLLGECLAEIERLSSCGCGGKVICGVCGRQIPNVAAVEPEQK